MRCSKARAWRSCGCRSERLGPMPTRSAGSRTVRWDVLDRMLTFGRQHLESVLVEFVDHYNQARPHQGIEQRRPCEPADVVPLPTGPVELRDRLGGIIHEYSRAAW